ncbi:hypothetical protein P152DRAFT_454117 [Eremomyces bilateralis CBS 781.70]|uniref:NEDD8-activating enzyme E1 regulatory subunit n=1 Tax=Eremomyces bilateralis CBS 781.70 TaxID=1392243 RepID=A0A6G1GI40_9PEZI|nr:uncharacterized protein P152DRAFT_454117 [Eremomyces bilateralis CBS 781.70]KAF1817530.1 hypothetical protein P152DRAFT_454117 [Eremomyces bilateralis CBS 781.70]
MTETIPPPLQPPTSKERKYDRQLRLWAATGQRALEESHILLVNSGPGVVGVETLKNLVLPGIGNFTILDDALVCEADLGVNFFLDEDSLGSSRAEQCCRLLQELNPDVSGNFIAEPTTRFLDRPDSLQPFTLILLTSPVDPTVFSRIAEHGCSTQTPVFFIHSLGFYSEFSVQLPAAFPIIDTHPDPTALNDLRILKPWPALEQLAHEFCGDLDQLDDHDHGHIPYVALLLHFVEKWKAAHGGNPPENYAEKSEYRKLIYAAQRRDNPERGEENYMEAYETALKSLNAATIRSSVRDVFEAPECKSLATDSAPFWVIANAVSQFHSKHGVLPLSGSLPDMKAQSADYVKLQTVYRAKFREDAAEILGTVRALERSLRKPNAIPGSSIDIFCKNAAHIKLVRGSTIRPMNPDGPFKWTDRAKAAATSLLDETSLFPIHVAFVAYDQFVSLSAADAGKKRFRAPGAGDETAHDETDMIALADQILSHVFKQAGQLSYSKEDLAAAKGRVYDTVREVVRAGGAELHNIAALTGGLIAQEVIKVVTEQYIPIDNTCIFDGIRSKTEVHRL